MVWFHLVEDSLPFLLGPAPRHAFLLNLAVAGCLFLSAFVPAFALILLTRALPTDERNRRHGTNTTGVPYWAQPLLLLIVFPLAWIWELLDNFARRDVQPATSMDRLFLILPCLLIVMLVHEMGHIFAAKAVGFRVHRVRVGPCVLYKRLDNWSIRFDLAPEVVKSLPAS